MRCKLLAFVLDTAGSEGRDPLTDLQNLRREINLYDPALSERPWLIVANKCDLAGSEDYLPALRQRFGRVEIIEVSAMQGAGMEDLKGRLALACGITPAEVPARSL
jgi:GTP-binding protein